MTTPAPGPSGAKPAQPTVWAHASVLLYHWRLVVGLPVLVAVVVGAISLVLPRKYKASASFVPEESPVQQGTLSLVASQLGIGTRSGATSPLFYADLLQSRDIMHGVVLTSYGVQRPSPRQGNLAQLWQLTDRDTARAVDRTAKRLQDVTSVRTDRNTGIVSLDVTTDSPDLSEQIVERFLALVSDFNLRRRQSQAHAEREFTQQRLAEARAALDSTENGVKRFFERNRQFRDDPSLVLQEASLQRQVALRQQLFVTLSQSYAAAEIEEVRDTPVISLVESPEGSAVRLSRGTVLRTIAAFFVALLASVAGAYAREYLSLSRASSPDYARFQAMLSQAQREASRAWPWSGSERARRG